MESNDGQLTDADHNAFDKFLGAVLNAYRAGEVEQGAAVADVMHVVAALDKGNIGEVRAWLRRPYKPDR